MRFVVTGGMGFFGSVLIKHLAEAGHQVVSLDILRDPQLAEQFESKQVDIADRGQLAAALADIGDVDGIFHVAAVLAHDRSQFGRLRQSNVVGTDNVMAVARQYRIGKVVFTSSNCVFAASFPRPVDESAPTAPIEEYGKSKLAAEEVITSYGGTVDAVILRCPTIISAGRMGLLTILFDFVREGRRLYLLGDGSNRYSFIYAPDLARACELAMTSDRTGIYHVGSDNVPTIRQLYSDLAAYAGKKARFVELPEAPATLALELLNELRLSPLGPYHYRMLAANFVFDTTKIKTELGWAATRTNSEMLCEAYQYYLDHQDDLKARARLSPHRKPANAGIINLLRLIS